jgi:hypothetical protein
LSSRFTSPTSACAPRVEHPCACHAPRMPCATHVMRHACHAPRANGDAPRVPCAVPHLGPALLLRCAGVQRCCPGTQTAAAAAAAKQKQQQQQQKQQQQEKQEQEQEQEQQEEQEQEQQVPCRGTSIATLLGPHGLRPVARTACGQTRLGQQQLLLAAAAGRPAGPRPSPGSGAVALGNCRTRPARAGLGPDYGVRVAIRHVGIGDEVRHASCAM